MPEVRNYFFRERCAIVFMTPTLTKQSMRDQCDANAIMRKWQSTGVVEHIMKSQPTYGDFSNVGDYLESFTRIQSAEDGFMALPSELRARCGNDPAEFVKFMNDPTNAAELRTLGLGKLMDDLHGVQVDLPLEPEPKGDPEPPTATPEPDAT